MSLNGLKGLIGLKLLNSCGHTTSQINRINRNLSLEEDFRHFGAGENKLSLLWTNPPFRCFIFRDIRLGLSGVYSKSRLGRLGLLLGQLIVVFAPWTVAHSPARKTSFLNRQRSYNSGIMQHWLDHHHQGTSQKNRRPSF